MMTVILYTSYNYSIPKTESNTQKKSPAGAGPVGWIDEIDGLFGGGDLFVIKRLRLGHGVAADSRSV